MTTLFQKVILFSLIPVFMMVIGGLIAIIRQPNSNVRSLILHFAAGVVFSVVAVEILPDVVKGNAPMQAIIGFTLGFLLMVGIRHFLESDEKEINALSKKGLPIGLLIAIGVDIVIDGLLLGVLFAYLQMYKVQVRLPKPAYVYGISAVVLVASIYVDATLYYILGYFLIALNVSTAIFLAKNKPSYLAEGKTARLIYFISVSSYSLYLTHPLMIHLSLWFMKKMHIEQSAVKFCFTFLLALAIGFLIYALVEKPILKWRERYVPTT